LRPFEQKRPLIRLIFHHPGVWGGWEDLQYIYQA
jgi:hypothetical protein